MASDDGALLTAEEASLLSFGEVRLDADGLFVLKAQHRRTLRWVADWLESRPLTSNTHNELRALADGCGEG